MAQETEITIEKKGKGIVIKKDGEKVNLREGEALLIDSTGVLKLKLAGGSAPAAPAGAFKKTVITVGASDGLRPAVITRDGLEVDIAPGDSIAISASGAITNGSAAQQAPAEKTAPEIGDVMEDGTIYAGISPTTGRPMYAVPSDSPLRMKFRQATDYAKDLSFGGHDDYRLPDGLELMVLFNNQSKGAFKDTFARKGDFRFYWASTSDGRKAQFVNFELGHRNDWTKRYKMSVRCIRG
jgi:hypothetical protein